MSDTVPKPYWYDTLKQMHLNGPTEAGNINNKDALEELEYIVEVDGDEECVLTSKGESALTEYQSRSLEFAIYNVSKIISIITASLAAAAAVVNELSGIDGFTLLFIFVIVVLFAAAYLIERAFNNALD